MIDSLLRRIHPQLAWLAPVLLGSLLAGGTLGVALWTPGCGGEDLCFACNPDGQPTTSPGDTKVRIAGTIRGIVGGAPVDQVRVAICLGLIGAGTQFGDCLPEDLTVGPLLSRNDFGPLFIRAGTATLAFVWDQGEDGYSDEDPIAVLLDDGALAGLDEGVDVFVQDADVDFARGTATAGAIDVTVRPTATPRPTTTPAPSTTP